MKIFTKKFWQTRSHQWMRSWQMLNANRKIFMFKYAYDTKSKVQCIFAPIMIAIVLFMFAPIALMKLIAEGMEHVLDTALPIIRTAIGMDMKMNPEWYDLSQQDKINKWKTW